MYKIGSKVSAKDVRRANYLTSGHPAYFDDGIDVEGKVTQIAHFIDRRVLIEFRHEGRDYHVWMYEFDLPNNESGNTEPVRQSN